ncbi:BamA/TamA family outer membrane protein [Chondromyces crocatus]|uniref:Outer membrane protein n=1 Tax=Chondromyces crocatus TaxID=52 RepID=A0A0K1E9X9_CHOCO|nr:BamA/TamA family outer membrane protein [Chondromyces crocatus]AKT37393.1 outer membrane protein [Chondromyces crocatus]
MPSRPRLPFTCALLAALTSSGAAAQVPPGASTQAPSLASPPSLTPSTSLGPPTSTEKTRLRYHLEGIEIRGNTRTAERVLLRYVRFRAGDVLDVDDPEIELTRYRLLGTGFFSSVDLSLLKGSARGAARLVIDVVERNTFVVQNFWLSLAADEDTAGNARPQSAFTGVQVAETNLAGTGITLGAGIGLAADQLALRTRFLDPSLGGTGWSAAATLLYNDARDFFGSRDVSFESPLLEQREVTRYAVVSYKRFGATLGTGHDLGISSWFSLDYHLEQIDAVVPTVASHLRGQTREPLDFDILPGTTVLSTLRTAFTYDTRDAPFLATRGTYASASITAGLPPLGSDYGFARIELGAAHWLRLPWARHVLRLEAFAGAIAGKAPFFEKFYVGDFTDLLPDRVLDLAPDRRKPPNLLGTDIVEVRYGDFAARLEGEYRIPVYTGRGSIYGIDLFATLGIYSVASARDLSQPPSGYTGFARAPVDLTGNLGLRIDTSVGGVTLAFSNLIGLLPSRTGAGR